VRQRAMLGRDSRFLFDVVLGTDVERPIILIVAGPERIRSIFFLTRADGLLRRTVAGIQKPHHISNQMRPMRSCSPTS
jgi:hypothetical protein